MKHKTNFLLAVALGSLITLNHSASAQGTAFTYQGQLNSGGSPANGSYDVRFTLFATNAGGSSIAGPVVKTGIDVTNGLFTTAVDFGNVFIGSSNWLELAVRTNGASSFSSPLEPRQQLTPAPYAVYAETANAAGLTGTISGNGSGLTNLNALNLTGTVAAAQLPTNVALLDANQTFTGLNNFSASVGIGTASPLGTLELRNTGGRNLVMSGPASAEWSFYDSTAGAFSWDINGDLNALTISDSGIGYPFTIRRPSGNVGIGTTTPANTLEVQGSADFTGNVGIGTNAPLAQFHVVTGQYGSQPVAIFDVDNCGGICSQQPYQENIRLVNLNPNGQTGLSFLTSTNGADNLSSVPAAWIGTGYTSFNDNSLIFASQTGGALVDRMYLQGNTGFLGIGTDSPGQMLEVNGTAQVDGAAFFNGQIRLNSTNGFSQSSAGQFSIDAPNLTGGRLTVLTNGNVGIGTTTPAAGLEVETSGSVNDGNWSFFRSGAINTNTFSGSPSLAIYTAGNIGAATYYAFSDARIKNIIGISSSDKDLQTLRAIEVTDYTYKDTVGHGNRPVKKVIAQQVESVYPQAVSQTTGVIPDIYRKAPLQDGWVQLATNLKVGERVKLIAKSGQGTYSVLEVRDGAFRTEFKPGTDEVFVFGREVKDFRNVDYEALTTLNVSATQELARKLDAQQAAMTKLQDKLNQTLAEKDTLLKHLAALEARDQAREDRLARLESSLATGSTSASYASLNQK